MELSILVAKIVGLSYVALGIGMLLNGAYYKKVFDDLMKSPGFTIFGGIMALIVGVLLVNFHNFWVKDWTVIITILGWLALAKGVLLFVAPKFLFDFSRSILKHTVVVGLGVLIFGVVLGYFGFFG